ncbi:MAG: VOC family protein [Acidimicrobiia bacterium]
MTLTPALHYQDPKAAIAWLGTAFGAEVTMAIDAPADDPTQCHYELRFPGGGDVMVGAQWADWARSPASVGGANTQALHVGVDGDVDAHCERARAAGAAIQQEPADQFYGDRTYRAVDPEGHVWTFAAKVREVTRAEAEAALGTRIEATDWA